MKTQVGYIWICLSVLIIYVNGHARIMEPPARNTMWRFGFVTAPNYEDSQMFCGGIKVQWFDNQGKCGLCGDPYNSKRDYETGGRYAPNITTRTYAPGSTIDVLVDLVANHGGHFTFQMCWRNKWTVKETENCFEPLKLLGGTDNIDISKAKRSGYYIFPVQLPPNRTCSNCIFRWHWLSGNNWGLCPNGTESVGCGPQETYRNCADIKIDHEFGVRGPDYSEPIYNSYFQEGQYSYF